MLSMRQVDPGRENHSLWRQEGFMEEGGSVAKIAATAHGWRLTSPRGTAAHSVLRPFPARLFSFLVLYFCSCDSSVTSMQMRRHTQQLQSQGSLGPELSPRGPAVLGSWAKWSLSAHPPALSWLGGLFRAQSSLSGPEEVVARRQCSVLTYKSF